MAFVAAACATPAIGALTVVTGASNANQWFGNAGGYTGITFTGFASGTLLTDQYDAEGVHFANPGTTNWFQYAPDDFIQDDWGLTGSIFDVQFDTPLFGLAVYYRSWTKARFYSGTELVYYWEQTGPGAPNSFAGFFSDIAFDRVIFKGGSPGYSDWWHPYEFSVVNWDNLYFTTVPAPASVIVISALLFSRRSRSSGASRI